MFGVFQQSNIRIEIPASEQVLRATLLQPDRLRKWLFPLSLSNGLPEELHPGLVFTSQVGPIAIVHKVEYVEANALRLLLCQGIDGYHEWRWGEGWVQSQIEGISLLPIGLGQTVNLSKLRQFLIASNS
uniref:SRPBCC domain-containing protein n=1 Tax=Oscillatoriales cyanobacterium SpSt-402 TaxID=2282168 RepID=A0A832H267_9CYAN